MKVLITGASGCLGSHLAELFNEAGHDVRAFVRKTSRTGPLEEMGLEIVRGDLKNPHSLARAVEGMEVVVHAASTMSGTPQEFAAATVQGTRDLLAAAETAGVGRFVYVSSIVVLSMQQPAGGEAISEDAPYETDEKLLSHYTRSKLEAEKAVLEYAGKGRMAVLVLRPGLLYGPRGKVLLPRTGYPFGRNWYVVIGMGGNPLPVCYVRNCADAILKAAEMTNVTEGVFNIVDDETFTQIEYLREIKYGVRPGLKIVRMPYLLARVAAAVGETAGRILKLPWPFRTSHMIQCRRRLKYSNEKARQLLGWEPRTGKKEALAATARYFTGKESFSRRADIRFVGRPCPGGRPLRTCLIGCGMIAKTHAKILSGIRHSHLAGLCDSNPEAARELAGQYPSAHPYTEVRAMLKAERPDVVHVLTPPQSHETLTEIAAEFGCNVLVEKPMALDAAAARKMADIAEKANIKLCVDHNHLYDPVMVETRKLLELGRLGDILWVESYYGFDLGSNPACRYMLPGGEKHWTFRIPGGLYQNLAAHPICLALEVLGAPTKVSAHARYGRVLPHAPNDELRVLLETSNASGLVTVSLAASPRHQYLHIYGTRMTLFVDLLNKWIIAQGVMKGVPKPISRAMMNIRHGCTVLRGTLGGMFKVLTRRWTPYDGMESLIKEFYRAIQSGEEPPVTPEDAIQVMEIMDETWKQIGPLSAGEDLKGIEAG